MESVSFGRMISPAMHATTKKDAKTINSWRTGDSARNAELQKIIAQMKIRPGGVSVSYQCRRGLRLYASFFQLICSPNSVSPSRPGSAGSCRASWS